MSLSKQSQAASTREFKHRVLTLLQKLYDRDTHSSAAAELETITKSISPSTLPSFLSSIISTTTDTTTSPTVLRQCLHLISLLSTSHPPNLLSPYLPKLISSILRLLPLPSLRPASLSATASLSSNSTKLPFSSFSKPFLDALVMEQDLNFRIGAGLCLAKAIEVARDPDVGWLGKVVVPRMERLLRCQGFKGKAVVLEVIGSVVGVGGVKVGIRRSVVNCLVEVVRCSEDWKERKAAADALIKLGLVERENLSEFKVECLRTFEAKRFDKVKIVREMINQMVEVWKEIPDLSHDVSAPTESPSCSNEDASDGHLLPGSKVSTTIVSEAAQIKKKTFLVDQSPFPDGSPATTARKRTMLDTSGRKTGPAMFRKLDRKKPSDLKVEIATPRAPLRTMVGKDDPEERNKEVLENCDEEKKRFTKAETRRALFNKNSGERVHKFGGFKAGSQIVPCNDERSEAADAFIVSNANEDLCRNRKDSEELSLIRQQLVQIETQQFNLLNLLQRFIGSSQNGMQSLETRVHGLELVLDEISYDLAMSTRRMSNPNSAAMCWKIPGAEFLSSKFWGRTEGRYSTSRILSSGNTSVNAMPNIAHKNGNNKTFNLENRRIRLQGSGGFIMNPLADINNESQGISEVSSNRFSKNISDST